MRWKPILSYGTDESICFTIQWCVCDMSVGINDVICLHTGHRFGEIMGFHIFGDHGCFTTFSIHEFINYGLSGNDMSVGILMSM